MSLIPLSQQQHNSNSNNHSHSHNRTHSTYRPKTHTVSTPRAHNAAAQQQYSRIASDAGGLLELQDDLSSYLQQLSINNSSPQKAASNAQHQHSNGPHAGTRPTTQPLQQSRQAQQTHNPQHIHPTVQSRPSATATLQPSHQQAPSHTQQHSNRDRAHFAPRDRNTTQQRPDRSDRTPQPLHPSLLSIPTLTWADFYPLNKKGRAKNPVKFLRLETGLSCFVRVYEMVKTDLSLEEAAIRSTCHSYIAFGDCQHHPCRFEHPSNIHPGTVCSAWFLHLLHPTSRVACKFGAACKKSHSLSSAPSFQSACDLQLWQLLKFVRNFFAHYIVEHIAEKGDEEQLENVVYRLHREMVLLMVQLIHAIHEDAAQDEEEARSNLKSYLHGTTINQLNPEFMQLLQHHRHYAVPAVFFHSFDSQQRQWFTAQPATIPFQFLPSAAMKAKLQPLFTYYRELRKE